MSEVQAKPIKPTVLLSTSDRDQCGIREYGRLLRDSVHGADIVETGPQVQLVYDVLCHCQSTPNHPRPDIIHVNHHAALHSSWRPADIRNLQAMGYKVVVTQHDTYEDFGIMMDRGFLDARGADALFIHERVKGIQEGTKLLLYIQQPIPEIVPGTKSALFGVERPTLGLVGFDFPWKGFDLAARAASRAGWDTYIHSPNLTDERKAELETLAGGPDRLITSRQWASLSEVMLTLRTCCSATAFLYANGNSGTSAGIRVGLGAGRPVIALKGACRQFRDLEADELGQEAISWVEGGEDQVVEELQRLRPPGLRYVFPKYAENRMAAVSRLRKRDSWALAGLKYQMVYKALLTKGGIE